MEKKKEGKEKKVKMEKAERKKISDDPGPLWDTPSHLLLEDQFLIRQALARFRPIRGRPL